MKPDDPADVVVAMLLLTVALFVVGAWIIMLCLGVISTFWPAIPALGYWNTVFILGTLSVVRLILPFRI